jgi:hypothetical protein
MSSAAWLKARCTELSARSERAMLRHVLAAQDRACAAAAEEARTRDEALEIQREHHLLAAYVNNVREKVHVKAALR